MALILAPQPPARKPSKRICRETVTAGIDAAWRIISQAILLSRILPPGLAWIVWPIDPPSNEKQNLTISLALIRIPPPGRHNNLPGSSWLAATATLS